MSRRLHPLGPVAGASALSAALLGGLGLGEVLGLVPALPPLLALGSAIGLVSSFARVPLRAVIQAGTPPGMMGRVAALTQAISTGTLLVAPFCGAWLASTLSVGAAFVLGAWLMGVVALGALILTLRTS